MQSEPVKRVILIVVCILLFSLASEAKDKQEWEEAIMTVYKNDQLTDSLKIVEIGNMTFDYCMYFRIMDEEMLNKYMGLMLPLIREQQSDNLRVFLYKPLFYVTTDPEDRKSFIGQYTGFVTNSTEPLIRFEGWMLLARGNMGEAIALNYLHNAQNEVKNSTDKVKQSEVNQYIAFYYSIHGNHASQLKYALRAAEQAERSGDAWQIVSTLKDLGAAYYEDPENRYVDQAFETYSKAQSLFAEKIGNKKAKLSYADEFLNMEILVTLGSIYQNKGQMGNAVNALEEALQIALAHRAVETQAFCHKELGILYKSLNNYSKAEEHYLKTEQLLEDSNLTTTESSHIEYEVQLQLATLYQKTRHFKEAAAYYEKGIGNYRRMFDEEIMNENQRLTAYYEAKKQEEDIAGLKTIVELKESQKYFYYGIAFFLILIFCLVYRLYHYKITVVKQQKEQLKGEVALLELDRSKAELQARLKQEESEQLQQKLTTGDELLEHKNNVIDDLKGFVTNHSELREYKSQIENILMQQNRIESNVDEIKSSLQDVPIDLYVRLQKQASNKLTPLDLKYCRLIYLKTPSKEMSEFLFVDPKTIRVNKYRLKQKLGLGKDDDLCVFIENIIPIQTKAPGE